MNKYMNRMFVLWAAVFLMAFMCPFVSAKSPGPCRYSVSEANDRLQLENDFILLEIDPYSGGRGTRLYYKSVDGELTVQGPDIGKNFPDGGLFGDRLVGGGNEFLVASYSVEVKKKTEDEISVLLSHKGGNWVLFEKLVTLKRDCSSLEILRSMSYAMVDPNAPKQKLGLWSHQSVRAGVSKDNKALKNTFFIPTVRGILEVPFIPGVTHNPGELDKGCYVRDCSRGWVGVVGEDSKGRYFGAVYEEDFRNLEYLTFYLNRTFADLPTSEFFHYVREMSDGDRFEAATSLIPVRGLKTITGAGQGVVGGIDFEGGELQKGKAINLNISLYSDRTREAIVSAYVERLPGKKAKKLFAPFQNARFSPFFWKLQEVISSGVLGEIIHIRINASGFRRRWDWQTLQENYGGNLMNTGPHPMDHAVLLFGKSTPKVFCRMRSIQPFGGDAEDFCTVTLYGKNAPVIEVLVSSYLAYPAGDPYIVCGTYGGLSGGVAGLRWKTFDPSKAPKQVLWKPWSENRRYCSEKLSWKEKSWKPGQAELDEFQSKSSGFYNNIYDAITKGAKLVIKPAEVRRQIAVVEECHRQNRMPKRKRTRS